MESWLAKNWFKLGVLLLFLLAILVTAFYFMLSKSSNYKMSFKEKVEMQDLCKDRAQKYFDEHPVLWPPEKSNFKSHYNMKLNKCFLDASTSIPPYIPYGAYLYDVINDKQYGEYSEVGKTNEIFVCEVSGHRCKSLQEFDNLEKSYMEE